MDPLTIGISSFAFGAFNLLSESSEYEKQKQRTEEYIRAIQAMKIGGVDKELRLDTIDRGMNTNIMSTLNDTSVGTALGGYLNPEMYKGKVVGQLQSKKMGLLAEESTRIDEFNRGIDLRAAEARMQLPTAPGFDSFFAGSLEGARFGMNLDYLQSEEQYRKDLLDRIMPKNNIDNTSKSYPLLGDNPNLLPINNSDLSLAYDLASKNPLDWAWRLHF